MALVYSPSVEFATGRNKKDVVLSACGKRDGAAERSGSLNKALAVWQDNWSFAVLRGIICLGARGE